VFYSFVRWGIFGDQQGRKKGDGWGMGMDVRGKEWFVIPEEGSLSCKYLGSFDVALTLPSYMGVFGFPFASKCCIAMNCHEYRKDWEARS
jgi:hypothetical protein